jgi:K+ transporter
MPPASFEVKDFDRSMSHKLREKTHILVIGALGIVFGDIGTSPLYALKVTDFLVLDPGCEHKICLIHHEGR